ncbi:hypothetical protein [Saccharicrinis aurantiacus]|uniref:hypothetical protein n=1 Tax=Saccharicrinis aurantiacus TaxID=1849719 RepID=UPI0015C56F5B|nr:hypothetical protein [Saccharicrinis aurantiacus]
MDGETKLKLLTFLFIIIQCKFCFGQDDIDRWDNWFLLGNKVVFGGDKDYRHSHELQNY